MGAFDRPHKCTPGESAPCGQLDAAQAISMTAAWAYVHGLASLLIDGRLKGLAASTVGIRSAEELVDTAIEHVQLISDAASEHKAGQAATNRRGKKRRVETSDLL